MLNHLYTFIKHLCEKYIEFSINFCQQNSLFILIIFRISIILNGIQELELVFNKIQPNDTNLFYNNISKFVITNPLFKNENEIVLIQLLIIHVICNFLIISLIYFTSSQSKHYYFIYALLTFENNLIIFPTLQAIFRFCKSDADPTTFIVSALNLIMYIQNSILYLTWKQTQLIDYQGIINNNTAIEYLDQMLTILAVATQRLSITSSYIILLIKYGIKLFQTILSFNHNTQFLSNYYTIKIIILSSLYFNSDFIYTLIYISFGYNLILKIRQLNYTYYLFMKEITFEKCQIQHLILNKLEINKTNLIQLNILKQSQNNQDFILLKGSLLQKLLNISLKNKNIENQINYQSLVKIYCNLNISTQPLKILIEFVKYFKSIRLLDQAYRNVILRHLNYVIKMNEYQLSIRLIAINNMNNETIVQSILNNKQAIEYLSKVVDAKINLLDTLRKGFSQIIDINDLVDHFTISIDKCRQFILQNYDIINYKLKGSDISDLQTLRILQLFFGIILNDLKQSKNLEKQFDDLVKQDKLLQDTTINNHILLQNRYLILKSSLINNRGLILNKDDKSISQFFLIQHQFVQNYQYIHEFMPDFIASIHDQLIDQYIQDGYSQLMKIGKLTFIQDPDNFILPVYIHLFHANQQDDFIIYSILTTQQQSQDYIIFDSEGKIHGISRKFFTFSKTQRSNNQDFSIFDIVNRGSSILYYMPQMANILQELLNNIKGSINNSVNNVRSTWQYPDNHLECITQTQSLINQSALLQKNQNFEIYGKYIKLLDPIYQMQFQKTISKKKTSFYSEYQIEMMCTLQPYFILNELYFLIIIKDYRLTDVTKTLTTNSNGQQISMTTLFTQFDHVVSDRLLTSDQGTIQDIKEFNTYQHQQILEKLFKDDDMSGRFVVDITQKNMLNASNSFTNQPFLSARLTQRLSLQGQQTQRQLQPSFYLPQISSKRNIDQTQLEIMEKDMEEIEISQSLRKINQSQFEQGNQYNNFIKNEEFYESNQNEESVKVSEKINDTQVQVLMKVQVQQGSQLQMIQEIINHKGYMNMVKLGLLINLLLTSWIIIMIIVNIQLVSNEMDTYFIQLSNSIPYQSLQFYIGVPYSILWTLYLNQLNILKLSPALFQNTEDKFIFIYRYSETQQMPFMEVVCSNEEILQNYFSDTSDCTEYFIKFQTAMLDPERSLVIDGSLVFDIFNNSTFYRSQLFYSNQMLINLLNDYIVLYSTIKLADFFIILLVINLCFIVSLFIVKFKMNQKKDNLRNKIFQILNRLSYNEIIELIAQFSCFQNLLNSNNWKLVNFYDLIDYDLLVKEKQNLGFQKKHLQLNPSKQKKYLSFIHVMIIVLSIVFFITFFVLGFVLYYILYEEFAPSFKIAQNFVSLKQKLDTSLCLGLWIKTAPIVGTARNSTEQEEMIKLFFNITEDLQGLLDDISQNLVTSSYLDGSKKDIILNTLNKDLCPMYQYLFCYPETLSSLQYYDSESYQTILSGGITGFLAQIYSYSVSEFIEERETLQFSKNITHLSEQIQQQTFKNIFIQYIQDIQYTMYTLFTDFNDGNTAAGQTLQSYIQSYNFGFGFSLIIIFNVVDFLRMRHSNLELQKLKYILLVLPSQKFENQIIKQKISEIRNYFF